MNRPEYPVKFFPTQEAFVKWLEKEHKSARGVWVKLAKKGSGVTSVTYDQALDVALCFGWIDSQAKSFDETYYLQKFTPRGPRSMWSNINKAHVARLINEGKMQPAGLAQIESAKKDGRWDRQ